MSQTAFYREFSNVYAVVGSVLESVSTTLAAEARDWFTDVPSVGSPSAIHGNAVRSGRTIKRFIGFLAAVHDATVDRKSTPPSSRRSGRPSSSAMSIRAERRS